MKVKVGDWVFGKVIGHSEHGIIVVANNEEVFVRSNEELNIGDEVQMVFKSFGIGCYWEAEKSGF